MMTLNKSTALVPHCSVRSLTSCVIMRDPTLMPSTCVVIGVVMIGGCMGNTGSVPVASASLLLGPYASSLFSLTSA